MAEHTWQQRDTITLRRAPLGGGVQAVARQQQRPARDRLREAHVAEAREELGVRLRHLQGRCLAARLRPAVDTQVAGDKACVTAPQSAPACSA